MKRKNSIGKSRWLCIEAQYEKYAGADIGTYAVAHITDAQLRELFELLNKTAIDFIYEHGSKND